MSLRTMPTEPDSHASLDPSTAEADGGPFGWLPRMSRRRLGLENRLERWTHGGRVPRQLDWLPHEIGISIAIDRPEIHWRAAGLSRASLVAHMAAPRLATRLAIGVEVPLAHAIVDRLLGFDRTFAESRLQLTPVEWGVWTFLFLRALDSFATAAGGNSPDDTAGMASMGVNELTLDRVGPDSFDPSGLGPIVTVRWPVRIGTVAAAVRLWLPESIVGVWLSDPVARAPRNTVAAQQHEARNPSTEVVRRVPQGELVSTWRAFAGTVPMSHGLKRLRVGSVLPLADSRLTGTPASPEWQARLDPGRERSKHALSNSRAAGRRHGGPARSSHGRAPPRSSTRRSDRSL